MGKKLEDPGSSPTLEHLLAGQWLSDTQLFSVKWVKLSCLSPSWATVRSPESCAWVIFGITGLHLSGLFYPLNRNARDFSLVCVPGVS